MSSAPDILQLPGLGSTAGLRHGFTTRPAGTGRLDGDRLCDTLGFPRARLAGLRQVHGNRVVTLTAEDRPGPAPEADAIVTDRPGLLLTIRTADCVPVLAADPYGTAIGAAHAGWRGLSLGLPGTLVEVLASRYGCRPEQLRIGIGAAIGPCCYTVGEEVRRNFAERGHDIGNGDFIAARGGDLRLDLVGAAIRQLRAAGVTSASIETIGLCTRCRSDLFFSYRRDGPGPDRLHAFIARDLPAEPD